MAVLPNCVATFVFILAWGINFSFAHKKVVVGVLVQTMSQKDAWNFVYDGVGLSVRNIHEDSVSESSNWMVDDNLQHYVLDYSRAFNLARQKFTEDFNAPAVAILFRELLYSSDLSLNLILDKLNTDREICDAFVIGFAKEYTSKLVNIKHGPLCEATTASVKSWNIPTIDWTCEDRRQHINTNASSLFNIHPPNEVTSRAVLSTLRHFKWNHLGWLSAAWPDSWLSICRTVEHSVLNSNDFAIHYYETFGKDVVQFKTGAEVFEAKMQESWRHMYDAAVTAVVLCLPHSFQISITSQSIARRVIASAYNYDTPWAETLSFLIIDPFGIHREKRNATNEEMATSQSYNKTRRSAGVSSSQFASNELRIRDVLIQQKENLTDELYNSINSAIYNRKFYGQPNHHIQRRAVEEGSFSNVLIVAPSFDDYEEDIPNEIEEISPSMDKTSLLYLLDSLYLMMIVISQIVSENGVEALVDERLFTQKMLKLREVIGYTGSIQFDERTGQRKMNYTIWQVDNNEDTSDLVSVATIDTGRTDNKYFQLVKTSNDSWEELGQMTGDYCDKGPSFLCEASSIGLRPSDFLLFIFGGCGIYVICYGVYSFFKKKKEWQSLLLGPNKVILNDADLKFMTTTNAGRNDQDPSPQASRIGSMVTLFDYNMLDDEHTVALLKGDYVFLKKICNTTINVQVTTLDLLRQMKDIRHENLSGFYGLYSKTNIHYLVMDYGYRQSLRELIANREMELNSTFKLSLISDLVRGMKYIHRGSFQCHGRLKSPNCLVDARFVLKITDYGVARMRHRLDAFLDDQPKDLLWTAPELLNDEGLRQIGTQKGDSFSFAIICQEILMQSEPFEMCNLSHADVIEKLKRPPPLLRPIVPSDAGPPEIVQIMKQCWQEQPELRLTFSAIHAEIKRMNRGKRHNIVENMMKQLEDYSRNLEDLVNERTAELGEEKKKTEQLLMRMLPPSVARLLMANKRIVPESFEMCSIYFSDICGFTTIAHASTPMQVVDFLNDLYTCFDAVIEKYEVYKVETIGDAYMVSSGIPKIIGERHAEEMSLMALEILSATTTFKITHLPKQDLRIRIGIHSGPAVAGVVGLTMPRYCLFGDTINTASRLESTGIPSRIHISSDTKKLLMKSNKKFQLEKRGNIELKGRGAMETWWLLGLEGFDKDLPSPGEVNGPSHGIAKIVKNEKNKSSNNSKDLQIFHRSRDKVSTFNHRKFKHEIISGSYNNNSVKRGSSFIVPTPLALIPLEKNKTFTVESSRPHPCSTISFSNENRLYEKNRSVGFASAQQKLKASLFGRNNSTVMPSCVINTVSDKIKDA